MYYSSACNRDLFIKVTIAVLFLPFEKSFKYYEIYFYSIFKNILKKKNSLLANIRNKCVVRKINLYFFDVIKNDQIVPSKVCHFEYDYIIFFSRKLRNI